MKSIIKNINKQKVFDYFILVARFLLAWTFLSYGFGKLVDGQFGITEAEMAKSVKDISLFKLSWYLFDHEPFKSFIGISQMICGLLLLINRTTLLGAFLFLPIVSTILIIDLSFMPSFLATSFAWRLSFYIVLDFLIIWHYRERMKVIWTAMVHNLSTKFKYQIWAYFLLPVFAILLEIAGILPRMITNLLIHPKETIEQLMTLPNYIGEILDKIMG